MKLTFPGATRTAAIDQILTIGHAPALLDPMPPLAARERVSITPRSQRVNKTVLFSAIAAAMIVANGGIAIAMLVSHTHTSATAASARIVHPITPSRPALVAVVDRVDVAPAVLSPSAPAITAGQPAPLGHSSRTHDRVPAIANIGVESATERSARTVVTAPRTGSGCASVCHGDTGCLMRCSVLGNTGQQPPAESVAQRVDAAPAATPVPARDDVQRAMLSLRTAVERCAAGRVGTVQVNVVFASSGQVTTATVATPYAGTPEGSCIARAMHAARLPAFARPTFAVSFPYAVTR